MEVLSPSGFDTARIPDAAHRRKINVLVISSVALSFITFWRAAAIVLCDLASSAYYIGGISEQAIGKAAPWFILAVMLFSYAVRAVYVESCTMFTRGGVYRVVKEAMGGTLAKLSVSALMFDYVLTGPISAVSAAQYIVGWLGEVFFAVFLHKPFDPSQYQGTINVLCVLIAAGITIYFWRLNIIGIGESSTKALRIMQATTVMGVLILGWSALTLFLKPELRHLPPMHPIITGESAGWLAHFPAILGTFGILIAFGHSVLAMSGEESLAQVNRELEAPKTKNLLKAGFVIFLYSMLLTSLISFFAVMIIPDRDRMYTAVKVGTADPVQVDHIITHDGKMYSVLDKAETPVPAGAEIIRDTSAKYTSNLISGLAMNMVGPYWLKVSMSGFVVIVGFLILAGAVNTSLVGSNGVMNRLAEDGVLTDWFLHPQKRYGTTHRLINVVTVLQLLTIVASWGDVNTLGEAYAFGVIWSFVFKTLAMVVLRFKDKSRREYEVPGNIRIGRGKTEMHLPIGITVIFLVLLSTAAMNLLTKKTATTWGIGFTIAFLTAFVICERVSRRKRHGKDHEHLEQFNQKTSPRVTPFALGLRDPRPTLVAVRNPKSLDMLERVLRDIDTDHRDVVVLTCKVLPADETISAAEFQLDEGDRALLTGVVEVAEDLGKTVAPLVLPTNNPLHAIALTARDLNAGEVVLGVSEKVHAEMQLEQFAMAWGAAMASSPSVDLRSIDLKPVEAAPATPSTPRTPPGTLTVRIIGPGIDLKQEMDA